MGEPTGPIIVVCALDTDGKIRSLEVDADDFLKVAFSAAAQGLVGIHGWIGSAWQKQPMLFGVSGTITRSWNNTSLSAGANNVDDSAVPAGEIWIITNMTSNYSGTIPNSVRPRVVLGGVSAVVDSIVSPSSGTIYVSQGWWVLEEDDFLRMQIVQATAGDAFYATACGFRIDVDQ